MLQKRKNKVLIISMSLLVAFGLFIQKKYYSINEKNEIEKLVNINKLSEPFMDNYFKEISDIKTDEEKENMLLVISSEKIKNSYGAKNIIESPNNQYILQYNSKEEKEKALNELKKEESIISVENNDYYSIDSTTYNSWGVEAMALDYAIDISNNTTYSPLLDSVTVAIIDTGCNMELFNDNYKGKITEYYNVLKNSSSMEDMTDNNSGHGTHIAGTIAESTPNNVKILPIKVSETGRNIRYSDIIAAINYIVHNKLADVINMSFGGYGHNEALEQAIITANQNNIISVAAAGNDNTNKNHYPSSLDSTIAVSSLEKNLETNELNKSNFSNYGTDIDFAAPGTSIKSINGTKSGTSMATPHVVSAIAILKSYNKDLSQSETIEVLKSISNDLGDEGWDEYFGHGIISFEDVNFCDNINCDQYGIFKETSKNITNIELKKINFTEYNYYSLTNIMASEVIVTYSDNTSEEVLLWEVPNLEIINYNAISLDEQEISIRTDNLSINIKLTNPEDYNNVEKIGWEYVETENNEIELTSYKTHNLKIGRLYIPDSIDSKPVVSIKDNITFLTISLEDFSEYKYLYLPKYFKKIGNKNFWGTVLNHVYGEAQSVELGESAFETSEIKTFNIPINKIGKRAFLTTDIESVTFTNSINEIPSYAFYNCFNLVSVNYLNKEESQSKSIVSVGEHAFDNCNSLYKFDFWISENISDYAFRNTTSLNVINIAYSEYIGNYSFYNSGLIRVELSNTQVGNSAFENCKKLKTMEILNGSLSSKAFWNTGIETIFVGDLTYIAEDAFAYSPIKNHDGMIKGTKYQVVSDLGIVEVENNKLIVGFTDSLGVSNTKIPEYITEIGNYAFTGNNSLENIIIPENINKIGDYAFKDCYNLSNVYMFGSNILLGTETFLKNENGDIQNSDLIVYIHKDSTSLKEYLNSNSINYRHIEPDEIVVINEKNTYYALERVNIDNIIVKLIYNEETKREEVLSQWRGNNYGPIANGVGFSIEYNNSDGNNTAFEYGDTYYTVYTQNILGYESSINIDVEVLKAIPNYKIPIGLTAKKGQKLLEIKLPENIEWMDSTQEIIDIGEVVYKAKYVPKDTKNYDVIENIDIILNVSDNKTIIIPDIKISDKVFDNTNIINVNSISISNLYVEDYIIVSAESQTKEIGKTKANIKIKLTDEKFKNYTFEGDIQEKVFEIDLNIIPYKYRISFNSNSGNGTMDSIELEYNEERKLPKNTFTKVGYKFINWNTKKDGTGISYSDEQSVLNLTSKEEVINLFAIWKEDYIYKVSDYKVNEELRYIDLIAPKTTKDKFLSKFNINKSYKVELDLGDKEYIYTRSKIKIISGFNVIKEFINIVRGDINGDSKISALDYVKIKNHIMKTNIMTDNIDLIASDANNDEKISALDYVKIKNYIMNGG